MCVSDIQLIPQSTLNIPATSAVMAKKMRFGKDGFVGMSDHNVSATDKEYGYKLLIKRNID